jgi:tRNA pseudouridine55 synthase
VSRCPAGVLNVAKPAGVTSRDVVNRVQWLVRPAKCGHAGTLDPLATGVLVMCIGAATRLIEQVQAGRKAYRGTFRLGLTSDTDDITGTVSPGGDPAAITADQLSAVLAEFVGRIEQVPPQVSAVHVAGERAYERVRRGETVVLAARPVQIDAIDLIAFAGGDFTIDVRCGGGTYIRAIGRDVGQRFGCGAVMTALERTRVGPFQLADALPMDRIDATTIRQHLQPPLIAVAEWPRMTLSPDEIRTVRCGQAVIPAASFADGTNVALVDAATSLIGLAKFDAAANRLRPHLVLPVDAEE